MPFFRVQRVGISISDTSVEIVQVASDPKSGPRIVAVAEGPVPAGVIDRGVVKDPKKLAAFLRELMGKAKPEPVSASEAVVALPEAVTFFHRFQFPGALGEGEVEAALAFETEEIFPIPQKELVGDFYIARSEKTSTDVVYAVTHAETLDGYRKAFAELPFRSVAFEPEAMALVRSLTAVSMKTGANPGKATLILDLGARVSTLIVSDPFGLQASFTHPNGGDAWTASIGKALKVDLAKAEEMKRKFGLSSKGEKRVRAAVAPLVDGLVRDIARVVDWYILKHENAIGVCLITGGGSLTPGAGKAIADQLASEKVALEVRDGDPTVAFSESPALKVVSPARALWAPAIGAALAGIRGEQRVDFSRAVTRVKTRPAKSGTAVKGRPSKAPGAARAHSAGIFSRFGPSNKKLVAASMGIGVIAIVLLAAFVLPRFFDRAGEERTAEPEPFSFAQTIVIDPTGASEDALPGRSIARDGIVNSVSVTPSATLERDAVATGIVTLYNTSQTAQSLVATTRLISETGVLFRLTDPVTVPANGSVDAAVYADQPGASGNIPTSRFTIPGLPSARQEEVYAESSESMTGGVETVGVLGEADVAQAKLVAMERVRADLGTFLESELVAGERWLPGLVRIAVTDTDAPPLGTEASHVTVNVTLAIEAVVFSEGALQDRMVEIGSEQAGRDLSAWEVDVTVMSGAFPEGAQTATLEVSANFYPQ
jgi:type IV pilus assembly protein PilM